MPSPMKTPLFQVLFALGLAGCCTAAQALSVQVVDMAGRPVADVVVEVSPNDGRTRKSESANRAHARMDQRNREFVPHVLVIEAGTWVDFPNSDSVSHQVYSFSPAKPFQLPLYKGRAHPPVLFDRAGLVTLGCNIHDNMLAYIVVTAAPFYGRADDRGYWTTADVPEGRYRVRVWHPLLNEPGELQQVVEIGAERGAAEFRLSKALRPAPLGNRPHSWDY